MRWILLHLFKDFWSWDATDYFYYWPRKGDSACSLFVCVRIKRICKILGLNKQWSWFGCLSYSLGRRHTRCCSYSLWRHLCRERIVRLDCSSASLPRTWSDCPFPSDTQWTSQPGCLGWESWACPERTSGLSGSRSCLQWSGTPPRPDFPIQYKSRLWSQIYPLPLRSSRRAELGYELLASWKLGVTESRCHCLLEVYWPIQKPISISFTQNFVLYSR